MLSCIYDLDFVFYCFLLDNLNLGILSSFYFFGWKIAKGNKSIQLKKELCKRSWRELISSSGGVAFPVARLAFVF